MRRVKILLGLALFAMVAAWLLSRGSTSAQPGEIGGTALQPCATDATVRPPGLAAAPTPRRVQAAEAPTLEVTYPSAGRWKQGSLAANSAVMTPAETTIMSVGNVNVGGFRLPAANATVTTRSSSAIRVLTEAGEVVGTVATTVRFLGAEDRLLVHVAGERADLPEWLLVPAPAGVKGVVLPRAHRVRVRVETPTGAAIPSAQVFWTLDDGARSVPAGTADEQGVCTLERVAPMQVVRVCARPPATTRPASSSAEFTVTGEKDQDVVLVVEPDDRGDPLVVRLEGGAGLEGAGAMLTRESDGGMLERSAVRNSHCRFAEVPLTGSFTLWIAPLARGGPCVFAEGLRFHEGGVSLRPQPSLPLRVRPLARGRPTEVRVTAHRPGIRVDAVAEADGSYVVPGLPEGPVRVTATAWSDDPEVRILTGAVDARAGEEVSLPLR